ncbi:hypothetical protein BV378_36355 [Nostoc sp. RF31YmG]|nr:hypothetical protein BV378_36355 [Nostoc sp. RF31YmG]
MKDTIVFKNISKRLLTFILIFCLVLNYGNFYATSAYAVGNNDYAIPQCKEITEANLRNELTTNIEEFFVDETRFDFQKIVNNNWQVLKFDDVLNNEIDHAVDQVQTNTNLGNKFISSWFPGKAKELAQEVIEIALTSPGFDTKIKQLSNNVAEELSNKLQLVSAKSSSYAMDCLQEFIGRQYSQTFVDVFAKDIKSKVPEQDQLIDKLNPDTNSFLKSHNFAFGGIGVLIATQITKVIAKKISNRVAQQLLDRFLIRFSSKGIFAAIPVAGEIIGGLLLVGDVFQSFDGALPAIQDELKQPKVKQDFKEQIANTVEEGLRTELPQVAREISSEIYIVWKDFQVDYKDTLDLAEELPEFKDILTKTTDKSKVYFLVGIALNNMGRTQLVASIRDGSFERALFLPDSSYKIIETTRSLPVLIDWANLAGNKIEEVVSMELYKHLSPKDLDRQLLTDILSIKDSSTIAKLSLLNIDSIRNLLTIAKQNLIALSIKLSPDDLGKLASYLGKLEQYQANQLVMFLLDEPSIIKNTSVTNHIIQSRDIKAAIKFWKAEVNIFSLLNGTLKLYTGVIAWGLFINKYGMFTIIILMFFPILLLLAIVTWFLRQLLEISKKQKTSDTNQVQKSSAETSKTPELLEINQNQELLENTSKTPDLLDNS